MGLKSECVCVCGGGGGGGGTNIPLPPNKKSGRGHKWGAHGVNWGGEKQQIYPIYY